MTNQKALDYITSGQAKGISPVMIRSSLIQAGWQPGDVDAAFTQIANFQASNQTPVINSATPSSISESDISESDYPITTLWIFKYPIIMVTVSLVAIIFGIWFPYFVIAIPYFLIANPLIRKNFHFALEKEYFAVKQGVLSKKQRNLPYGVIQNVLVKQDIFDRLFGIAALTIENASEAGGSGISKWFSKSQNQNNSADFIGSQGNKVSIPGLKKADAEALKSAILAKMKENPLGDTQSGL